MKFQTSILTTLFALLTTTTALGNGIDVLVAFAEDELHPELLIQLPANGTRVEIKGWMKDAFTRSIRSFKVPGREHEEERGEKCDFFDGNKLLAADVMKNAIFPNGLLAANATVTAIMCSVPSPAPAPTGS